MRIFLLSAAVVCAVVSAGLIWGWGFLFFDERAYRQHSTGWLAVGAASFAAAFHPWVDKIESRASRWYER